MEWGPLWVSEEKARSLLLNHGNQNLIPIKAGKRGNPRRTMLGFAQLYYYTQNAPGLQTRCCLGNGNGNGCVGHGIGKKDGAVIVDHGSRRKESNLMLNEFVEKTGYPIVEPAHMDW